MIIFWWLATSEATLSSACVCCTRSCITLSTNYICRPLDLPCGDLGGEPIDGKREADFLSRFFRIFSTKLRGEYNNARPRSFNFLFMVLNLFLKRVGSFAECTQPRVSVGMANRILTSALGKIVSPNGFAKE